MEEKKIEFKEKDHVAFKCAGHKTHGLVVEVKDDGEYIVNSFGCLVAVKGEDMKLFNDKVHEKEPENKEESTLDGDTPENEVTSDKPKRGRKPKQ